MIRRTVLVCVAVVLGAATLSMNAAQALPEQGAVDRFGSCVAAAKSAQVLILIDTSGSLATTDPQAARVAAAKYLVTQLTDFSAESGAAIDVAVAGFADDYRSEIDWTRLDKTTLAGIESGLDRFASHDDGADTDYWAALNGARAALAERRVAQANTQSCQALAWFTDGKIDYSQHPGTEKPYAPGHDLGSQEGIDATVAAARESICRPGGLADQLRSSGVVTFGIGLAADSQNSSDFDVLKSIATAEPTAAGPCGDIRSPAPGAFYLASNIDDLLFAFDAFSTPGQPPQRTQSGVCPGTTVCENAKHRFTLDRSVRSVSVLASADTPGLIPVLVPPTGPPQQLNPDAAATLDIGGVTVDYRWLSEKSVTFRMTNPEAPAWQGQWALVFEDPSATSAAQTKTSIHISGDLFPIWPADHSTTLHQDETVPVTFAVVDGAQKPVDPATLMGQAQLSVVLIDANGANHSVAESLPKERITAPQQIDLHGVAAGKATLRLTLFVTTADAIDQNGASAPGTALSPQSVDLPVMIDPPVGYPSVEPSVDFGLLAGAGSVQRQLRISGSGCVWLSAERPAKIVAAPDGVGDVGVSSSAKDQTNCVTVADGQQAALPLTITVPNEGNGAVNGIVTVTAAPAVGDRPPVTIDVPFTLSVEKQLNTTSFAVTLIIALLLGPGIPLALMYLIKWWVSRIPGKALRAEKIPVQVRNATVLRDNQQFHVADGDLVHLVEGLHGPTRRLDIGGIELRTRVGLSPFGAGFVVATAPGLIGAGGKGGATHGEPPTPKLPLAVQNTWFVLHDPTGPQDAATVVLLVGGDAGRPVIDRLCAEITDALPRVLTDLRRRAGDSTVPPDSTGSATPAVPSDPFRTTAPPPGRSPFANNVPAAGPVRNPFGGSTSPPTATHGSSPLSGDNGRPSASPFGSRPADPGRSPFLPQPDPQTTEPPNPFRPN